MRSALLAVAMLTSLLACGDPPNRNVPGIDAAPTKMDACSGLECRRVDCAAMGMPPTTVSGTVYAPNETLALFGVNVYVPNLLPGPFPDGVKCEQCDPNLPGNPLVRSLSDENGHFTLDNVPVGSDVPLVITTGKWRRIVTIPTVVQCTDNPIPASLTRLPRNKSEGDLPKIAMVTGSSDALECLIRKIGVSDTEFTNASGTGRVHLYDEGGHDSVGSTSLTTAHETLWNSLDKMKEYDLQLYSCEGSEVFTNKPQQAFDNVKSYADAGGRVFLSHYHHVWFDKNNPVTANGTHNQPAWENIATCESDVLYPDSPPRADVIDQINNPKGMSFAAWMVAVGGSTTLGNVPVASARKSCTSIDMPLNGERWVYGPDNEAQVFQITTPVEVERKDRCGKVVFSDMHVASGSSSFGKFPAGCMSAANTPLTPQEKALAFMFFDIASCVSIIN